MTADFTELKSFVNIFLEKVIMRNSFLTKTHFFKHLLLDAAFELLVAASIKTR